MTRLLLALSALAFFGVVLTVWYTPWNIYSSVAGQIHHSIKEVAPDVTRDFTSVQISREVAFLHDVRAWQLLRIAISIVLPLVAFWAFTIFFKSSLPTPSNVSWWLYGLFTLCVIRIASLPCDWMIRRQLINYGLNTQSVTGWLSDVARSFALSTPLILVLVALCVYASGLGTSSQIAIVPAVAGLLVVIFSFVLPVVVEPLFNSFTSLPDGALRTQLIDQSRRMDIPITDVLVADASRRTNALNAYVSGFGSTRRIVLYDTVLNEMPTDEIVVVARHELAHAKYHDVLHATLIGALFAATAALGIVALLSTGKFAGRELAVVLTCFAVISVLTAPLSNLVTRRVESRADVVALADSPVQDGYGAFIRMQQRLATSNLSSLDPSPWIFAMFSTHPTPPQRIAIARTIEMSAP